LCVYLLVSGHYDNNQRTIQMPIVNCFTKKKELNDSILNNMVHQWSEKIQVDRKDITMNFVTSYVQVGQKHEFIVFLYLPTLWSKKSISNIQTTLLELFIDTFKVTANEVFILTSTIESGNVIENGKVITW